MDDIAFRMLELNNKGYCCSQILMILALEELGTTNPDLVRAMGGLCLGLTTSEEVCGALSGGACLLALYAGKGTDEEEEDERLPLMLGELLEWFQNKVGEDYGGVRCEDILGDNVQHGPDLTRCGMIVAQTYEMVRTILENHGRLGNKGRNEDPEAF